MGPDLLAKYLKATDTTQDALAALCGVGQPTISALVTGRRGVGLKLAVAIEKATSGAVPAESWLKKKPARKSAA